MFTPTFEHVADMATYEKALNKFMKALATDTGKKFITHLTKAFIHSGTMHEVEEAETDFVKCDVTHAKLCTKKSMDNFIAIVNLRLSEFKRLEGESDEQFDTRIAAYFDALKSSNPYAVSRSIGYTADKTDKILCAEAVQALTNLYNQIKLEQKEHPDLWEVVRPYVQKPQNFNNKKKNFKKKQKPAGGQTLGDLPGMQEAITKLRN